MMKSRFHSHSSLWPVLLSLTLMLLTCGKAPREKVFVLGIDGLTLDLLLPWVQEGKLPHFARLLEEGSSTQLISSVPPVSPAAWTSATTGVNPGKHGVFGFVKEMRTARDGSPEMDYYTARDRKADPLWVILSERNRRNLVVNIPNTSPPDKIKGIMIAGFPHTSPIHFTYPPEYRLKIPNYRKDHYGRTVAASGEEAFLEDMDEIMNSRIEMIFELLEEESWDLFFAVFTTTDWIQHHFWKYMDREHPDYNAAKAALYGDAILKTYQRMDQFLGELRPRLDPRTALVVMSDHGFGPAYFPVNGQNFIDRLKPEGKLAVISGDTHGATFYITAPPGIGDDERTRQAYQRTRELLKSRLEQLRDPGSGQKIIQKVFLKEDLFWGPYAAYAPDVVGLENRGYMFWNWHPTEDGRLIPSRDHPIFERIFNGYHRMNGTLIMTGAPIRSGANNFDARIFDVTPTVLYLLGEPIPQDMDGKVLQAPITEDFIGEHPLEARWARDGSPRQIEQLPDSAAVVNEYIEEQLRAIGYVQ